MTLGWENGCDAYRDSRDVVGRGLQHGPSADTIFRDQGHERERGVRALTLRVALSFAEFL